MSDLSPFSLYLASQSPRRQALLAQIGVRFAPLPPEPGEDAEALEAERDGETPEHYVVRVCAAKAQAAVARLARSGLPPLPVLTADTTVTIDGRVLGKPADHAEAAAMLARLSGRTHQVLTAVAISGAPAGGFGGSGGYGGYGGYGGLECIDSPGRTGNLGGPRNRAHPDHSGDAEQASRASGRLAVLSVSTVRFAPLTPAAIERYVASGEPFGKAGGYGIQGLAAEFIAHIEGSYSGIMGLPLFETAGLLRLAGVAFPR